MIEVRLKKKENNYNLQGYQNNIVIQNFDFTKTARKKGNKKQVHEQKFSSRKRQKYFFVSK